MQRSIPMALHGVAGLGGVKRVFYVGALVLLLILMAAIEALAQVHGAPTTPGPPGLSTTPPPNPPGISSVAPPAPPGQSSLPPPTNAPGLPSAGATNSAGGPGSTNATGTSNVNPGANPVANPPGAAPANAVGMPTARYPVAPAQPQPAGSTGNPQGQTTGR